MGTGHGRGRLAFSVIPAQAGTQSPHDEDCVNTHWAPASAGETGWARVTVEAGSPSPFFRASRNPVALRPHAACGVVQPHGLWTPAFAGETRTGVTQESSKALDPCFRGGDGGQGSQTTRLTKTICAGRIECDCPGRGLSHFRSAMYYT